MPRTALGEQSNGPVERDSREAGKTVREFVRVLREHVQDKCERSN